MREVSCRDSRHAPMPKAAMSRGTTAIARRSRPPGASIMWTTAVSFPSAPTSGNSTTARVAP